MELNQMSFFFFSTLGHTLHTLHVFKPTEAKPEFKLLNTFGTMDQVWCENSNWG